MLRWHFDSRSGSSQDGVAVGIRSRIEIRSSKVIWPFLADSIAMAAVEAAIEEVDAAMEGYVAWRFGAFRVLVLALPPDRAG